MNEFSPYPWCTSISYTRVHHELPSLKELFPYEICASQLDNICCDAYTTIQTIPYGLITCIYYSRSQAAYVIVGFNRFKKISAAWRMNTPSTALPIQGVFMGIHIFPEPVDFTMGDDGYTRPPLFVLVHTVSDADVNTAFSRLQTIWPYSLTKPYEVSMTSIQEHLLDVAKESPYTIHHLRYTTSLPTDYPNTTIRLRDAIDSNSNMPISEPILAVDPEVIIEDGRTEIFKVRAGLRWDTFYLYARADLTSTDKYVCYDTLYIATLEQSQYWNARFRSVQLRTNYDWIEHCCSQTRDSKQKGRKCTVDNYKQLNTQTFMTVRCQYHKKFRKWLPLEAMPAGRWTPVALNDLLQSQLKSEK